LDISFCYLGKQTSCFIWLNVRQECSFTAFVTYASKQAASSGLMSGKNVVLLLIVKNKVK